MARSSLVLALTASALAQNAAPGQTKFVQGDPARFTYTNMLTPLSLPCDVSEGPDNNIYVQELIGKIAQYNYKTGALKEFDIPFTSPLFPNATLPLPDQAKAVFLTCAIRNGFDGKMYFSNGNRNQLVQFDVHTEQIKVFTPPGLLQLIGNVQPFNDITTAPDGVYFTQTTMNTIAKFDYHTHQISYIPIPTLLSAPLGIYYAKDGAIWFLETAGQKVGRLDRHTQKITEYPLPLPLGAGPIVMRAETPAPNDDDDHLLWFATILGSSLCSIHQRSKAISCHLETIASTAQQVAQDDADNVWLSHTTQNSLGVFNPTYRNFTEVVVPGTLAATPVSLPPYGGSGIYGKPVGNPGTRGTGDAIWFTQLAANRLVRYDLSGLKY